MKSLDTCKINFILCLIVLVAVSACATAPSISNNNGYITLSDDPPVKFFASGWSYTNTTQPFMLTPDYLTNAMIVLSRFKSGERLFNDDTIIPGQLDINTIRRLVVDRKVESKISKVDIVNIGGRDVVIAEYDDENKSVTYAFELSGTLVYMTLIAKPGKYYESGKKVVRCVIKSIRSMTSKQSGEQNTGMSLSPVMGGFHLIEKTDYPDPNLGVSYYYSANNLATCTLFIYDGGQAAIAEGIKSDVVKDEFEGARSDVFTAGKLGFYQSLKELKRRTRTFKSASRKVEYLESSFRFSAEGLNQYSQLLLTAVSGRFVKVRCTYLEQDSSKGAKAVSQFLSDLSKEIKAL